MTHVITGANYEEAQDAIRDILMMYVEVAADGLFTHNCDHVLRFDPLKFVDAIQDKPTYRYVDVDLLRTGSALAIVAAFFNGWSEYQKVWAWNDTDRFRAAIAQGRLRHLPDIEDVLTELFTGRHTDESDPWFDDATAQLCERHVRSYFRQLTEPASIGSMNDRRGPADWLTV